jgi:spermidine synthase
MTDLEFQSDFHRIKVTDNEGVRLLQFERNRQSSMHIDDPFETDMEYPGYLHLTVAVKPDAARALFIGLGGGSVVKRMWRDYTQLALDVVEIDEKVVEVAHEYFSVPRDPRIRVFVDDGAGFIRITPEVYDYVVIDAFDDDFVPRPLLTEEFLRGCHDHLAHDGVVAYNVIGAVYGPHSRAFRSLYRTLRNTWRRVWVFPIDLANDATDRTRNIIVLASDAELSDDQLLDRIASRVDGRVSVPSFERFGEDLYRGKVRAGDVPILTEHATRSRGGRRRR